MDWERAKIEYITNREESYRSIAARYGVSVKQVGNRGKAEKWPELRKQHWDRVSTETVEAIGDQQVDRMVKVQNVADKLLGKLENAVDCLSGRDLAKNAKLAKGLTGAIKDIKEIMDLRSDADAREQEARIERLRSGMDQGADSGVTLVIEGGEEDWQS